MVATGVGIDATGTGARATAVGGLGGGAAWAGGGAACGGAAATGGAPAAGTGALRTGGGTTGKPPSNDSVWVRCIGQVALDGGLAAAAAGWATGGRGECDVANDDAAAAAAGAGAALGTGAGAEAGAGASRVSREMRAFFTFSMSAWVSKGLSM